MFRRKSYTWFVWVVLAVSSVWADPAWFVRSWQSDEGLPDNSVMGIDQTPDGFLWVATKTGLVRFDGLQFREFPTRIPGVVNEEIFALCADRKGRLWVAKERGTIICVEQGRVTVVLPPDPAQPKRRIRMLVEDGEGAIWASLFEEGIVRIKEGAVRVFTAEDGLPSGGGVVLAVDRKGHLWFTKFGTAGVFRDNRFVTVRETQSKYITAAAGEGVRLSEGKQLVNCSETGELSETIELLPEIVKAGVTEITGDRAGRLWIGTRLAGLFCYDGTQAMKVDTAQQTILCIKEDREGNIWVGTRGNGLKQVKPRVAELLSSTPGTFFEGIQSLCKDTQGELWAVLWHKGSVMRHVNNSWELLSARDGWTVADARCVTAAPEGGVWIGTMSDGVFLWRDGVCVRHVSPTNGLAGHRVTALATTQAGGLWIAGRNNKTGDTFLQSWSAGSFQTFQLPPGSGDVSAMAEDTVGNCWIATSRGLLFQACGKTWSEVTKRLLSEPCPIRTLLVTPDNSLWIGFAGMGLGRLKAGKFTQYRVEQGLHDDYISQVLSDEAGRLWLAGNRGISSVRINDLDGLEARRNQRIHAVVYKQRDGLPGLQASFEAWPNAFRDKQGRLFFAMQSGVVALYADEVKEDVRPPSVFIDRVLSAGQTVARYGAGVSQAGDARPEVLELGAQPAQLQLPPGQRQLEFFFTVPSFKVPESIRFKYRLVGLDRDWLDAGTHRSILYSRLAPGPYQFQVTACNRDGVWNEQGASLALTVAPYWWETGWFWLGGPLVLFSFVGCVIVVWLRRRQQRHLERLEMQQAMERERSRIAADLHDGMGSDLTQIGLLCEQARQELPEASRARGYLEKALGNTHALAGELDAVVWSVNPENDTLEQFVLYFSSFVQEFLTLAQIRLRLVVPDELPAVTLSSVSRHHLFMAAKEALHNVVRHAGAKQVTVRIRLDPHALIVEIEDDGCGLPATRAVTAGADGLANLARRMEQVNGCCEFLSGVDGRGTHVRLTLPVS